MGVQYSTAVRKGMLDAIEVQTGPNARVVFYTGAKPANCAAAASGSVIATLPLTGNSGDWMSAAAEAANVVTKDKHPSSSWSAQASAPGTVGHYRIYDSTVTVCHEQGSVTAVGGGGDITLDNVVVAFNQTLTIISKTITAGNG